MKNINIPVIRFLVIASLIIAAGCGQKTNEKATVGTNPVQQTEEKSESKSMVEPEGQSSAANDSDDPAKTQALCDAALEGNIGIIQRLISDKTNVNATIEEGRTGLMLAAYNGHSDILRLLINAGATVDARDTYGRTALMYASTGPFPEAVKLLLEKGADPNLVDKEERFTPLMFAAAEGHLEVAKVLLAHKANPNMMDKDGDTAERFARQNGHANVVELLRNFSTTKP